MRDSPDPEYMTVAQAADRLGVSRQRVHILVQEGALDSVRRHRHVYVSIASIEARLSPTPIECSMLTSTEVGQILGKTVKQVNKIVEIGALHPVRGPRGRLYFDPREVAAYQPRPAHRPRKEQS